jgi:hypothetical protein
MPAAGTVLWTTLNGQPAQLPDPQYWAPVTRGRVDGARYRRLSRRLKSEHRVRGGGA